MWIARDKDGNLCLFKNKPVRYKDEWGCDTTIHTISFDSEIEELSISLFPEVTWENSPKELIIKTKESEDEIIRTDEKLVEEVFSHLDSIIDTVDRMTTGNFMHNKAAIKFSANVIMRILELMGFNVQLNKK